MVPATSDGVDHHHCGHRIDCGNGVHSSPIVHHPGPAPLGLHPTPLCLLPGCLYCLLLCCLGVCDPSQSPRGTGGPITARMSYAITRGGTDPAHGRTRSARRVARYRVVEENDPEAVQQTRSSAGTVRPFGPLITMGQTRYSGITVPPISMCIMRIPPHWIRNLRWYSLMASTFALAWAWAWGIDVVLTALTVAVSLQFIAVLVD